MSEASTTLKQKASELDTAVDEARSELARIDAAQRSDAHRQLLTACSEAANWLERLGDPSRDFPGDEAASLSRQAETHLTDIRMKRGVI